MSLSHHSTRFTLNIYLLLGLFFIFVLGATTHTAEAQNKTQTELDAAAEAHAADSAVAGVSVAVVHKGDTLLVDGYGLADLEFDIPMPKDAVFEIGSITKQFTAAAILQLAGKDSLDIDGDNTDYLPDFNTRGHRVTLKNLLHHASGLRSYTNMSHFWDLGREDLPRDTLLTLLESEPFRFAPGTAMSYSNADLVKVIRFGIKNDDSLIRCCMPFAESYYHLSDRDVKAIIAYIRSLSDLENDDLPDTVGDKSENSFIQEILARIVGGYRHVVHGWTPVYEAIYTPRRSALPSDGPIAYGKYLTQTHCARCHSEDLSGDPGYWQTPNVAVGAGYSSEQFDELLRKGKALGDRDIGFMTPLAKEYLSHLTDSEIEAIHSYLQKRANSTSENLNLK